MREGATRLTTDRVLYQSGIPFWIPPGDGGSNGLNFTGTRGVFTLSAAAPMQYASAFTRNCYCYLPAGAGGLATGGLYWCEMSDDTNGEIFAETYSGTGNPAFVSSPTALPNLTAGRITQTTAEVTIITGTIPGGSLGPNGILRALMEVRYTNSATTKSFRVKTGAALISFGYLSGTILNCVLGSESLLQCSGVQTKQSRVSNNAGRLHAGTTTMSSADASGTLIDYSVDQPFSSVLQIGATTDSIIGILRKLTVEYGA